MTETAVSLLVRSLSLVSTVRVGVSGRPGPPFVRVAGLILLDQPTKGPPELGTGSICVGFCLGPKGVRPGSYHRGLYILGPELNYSSNKLCC